MKGNLTFICKTSKFFLITRVQYNIFYCRYDVSVLPTTSDELKSWLNDIWKQKEERLAKFSVTSSFVSNPQVASDYNQPINNALYLALMFWTLIQVHINCIKVSLVELFVFNVVKLLFI